ncbi:serine hydrolase domain-containing protein [Sulfuriroseicoccus oceanibius]|uniref:Beta-lactamase family protein n=1 Tax=Sulfuriroseicoccus oceanibius TaxID=2707525 RepID=A0A6B3L5M6_9BACT|nr:serine hydrolase domain-containing protein [Sulfuriroseicoccus oceanibius]QQL45156.1 beta-lactamase family protein [Sulfuriroseicoccus oceanibius]
MTEFVSTRAAYARNFESRNELGASVAVWKDGELVLSLAEGWMSRKKVKGWSAETLVPFYSVTKGLASSCVLHALDAVDRGLDVELHTLWPGFPEPHLTVGELLSHQGGLAALDRRVSVWDYDEVVDALEEQLTAWDPPQHGYHPRTYGFLLDEVVRRLTGAKTLGEYWRKEIAEPNGLDLWIGLPESEFDRVATLYPGKMTTSTSETVFYEAFNKDGSLTKSAFSSPRGLQSVAEMNVPMAWQAGLPAMGGIGTAAALATYYGMIACGALFSQRVRDWMETPLVNGDDQVLLMPTSFSAGMMKDPVDAAGHKLRTNFGPSTRAFGHPGAGGSHAFGDPENGVGFGYVMNQMELGVLPNVKATDLVSGVYADLLG